MTLNPYQQELYRIQRERADLLEVLGPLQADLKKLNRQEQEYKSKLFIQVNGIRKADVELSQGPGKPYFGTCHEFGRWLKDRSTKNWAEWNTCIYRTSDLVNGRMPEDMPATLDDLQA